MPPEEDVAQILSEPLSDDIDADIPADDLHLSDFDDLETDTLDAEEPQKPAVSAKKPEPVKQPVQAQPQQKAGGKGNFELPVKLKSELRNILSYMDQLLDSLPEEKIEEFAKSEYFDSYKKLFKDLGLV